MSTPQPTDLFLIQRGAGPNNQFKATYAQLPTLLDDDLVLVQRADTRYKATGAEVKAWLGAGTVPAAPWTPADEPTITQWFDSTDRLSITLNQNSVTEWRSQIGSAKLTQGIAGAMPITAGEELKFQNQMLEGSHTGTGLFAVIHPLVSSFAAKSNYAFVAKQTDTDLSEPLTYAYDTPGAAYLYTYSNQSSPAPAPSPEISSLFRQEGVAVVPPPNWIGASPPASTIRTPESEYSTPTFVSIGYNRSIPFRGIGFASANGSGQARCCVYQWIYISAAPSTELCEKLEGWAAHKYNIASKLPANHPYKAAPPTK